MALVAALFWPDNNNNDVVENGLVELQSATADLDSRLSATESQAGQVGAITERLATLEAAPATGGDADGGAAGEGANVDLADRLANLEQQLADLAEGTSGDDQGNGGETSVLDERLVALEQQIAGLSESLASTTETQNESNEALTALQGALPTLEASLNEAGLTLDATGQQTAALGETTERLGADMTALSERIGAAEGKLDAIGGEYQRAAAMVVAIGDVDRAISKAEPFDAALQSLSDLGQDDPAVNEVLSVLEPMAATGVPTIAGLKASFGEVGSQILLAADGDASLADQVSGNLFGIINMRPAGAEIEGDDNRAIVARAQAKLSADDLEGAIGDLSGLSEPGLASAEGWIADAKARLSAETAVIDLRTHAQSLLAMGS
ncbi:MAG: COG4223 family protein [Geminicoccales bacterium]